AVVARVVVRPVVASVVARVVVRPVAAVVAVAVATVAVATVAVATVAAVVATVAAVVAAVAAIAAAVAAIAAAAAGVGARVDRLGAEVGLRRLEVEQAVARTGRELEFDGVLGVGRANVRQGGGRDDASRQVLDMHGHASRSRGCWGLPLSVDGVFRWH